MRKVRLSLRTGAPEGSSYSKVCFLHVFPVHAATQYIQIKVNGKCSCVQTLSVFVPYLHFFRVICNFIFLKQEASKMQQLQVLVNTAQCNWLKSVSVSKLTVYSDRFLPVPRTRGHVLLLCI